MNRIEINRPECNQALSIPADKGFLRASCPTCQAAWDCPPQELGGGLFDASTTDQEAASKPRKALRAAYGALIGMCIGLAIMPLLGALIVGAVAAGVGVMGLIVLSGSKGFSQAASEYGTWILYSAFLGASMQVLVGLYGGLIEGATAGWDGETVAKSVLKQFMVALERRSL